MMRAALLHGRQDIRVEPLPLPEPGPGELLLRVRAVGVCGSDLHYYLEEGIGDNRIVEPLILGHEFAAEVIDERAEEFGIAPGTLVAVDPARPCGRCEWCRDGHPNLCPNVIFAGAPPYHGAMAEYLAAPKEQLITIPESFDADDAAMLEPLGIAIHALDLAHLRPLETVAVLGAGPIGLLLLQVARHAGAGEVYVVDPLSYRLQTAANLGASSVATSHGTIDEWTAGRGVDVVLEATNSPLGPQQAAEAVRIGGRLILVGIPEGDSFALQASLARRKGLTIKLSRRMGNVYPRAIEMLGRGLVEVKPIITHHFSLDEVPAAFELQAGHRDEVLKAVIHP